MWGGLRPNDSRAGGRAGNSSNGSKKTASALLPAAQCSTWEVLGPVQAVAQCSTRRAVHVCCCRTCAGGAGGGHHRIDNPSDQHRLAQLVAAGDDALLQQRHDLQASKQAGRGQRAREAGLGGWKGAGRWGYWEIGDVGGQGGPGSCGIGNKLSAQFCPPLAQSRGPGCRGR